MFFITFIKPAPIGPANLDKTTSILVPIAAPIPVSAPVFIRSDVPNSSISFSSNPREEAKDWARLAVAMFATV